MRQGIQGKKGKARHLALFRLKTPNTVRHTFFPLAFKMKKKPSERKEKKKEEKVMQRENKGKSTLPVPLSAVREKRNFFGEVKEAFVSRTRTELFCDILTAVCAFLFARTHALFGVYPFGLALLCGLSTHVLAALLGTVAGALMMPGAGPLYTAVYISIFFLRLIFSYAAPRFFESRGIFDEHPLFRVLEACVAGSLMAAYELALFGIYDYTVLFALGAVLLPPLLTLLYAAFAETGISLLSLIGKEPLTREAPSRTGASALFLQLGGLALGFSLVLSLRPFSFFGLSLARCALTVLTLFVSRRFGGVRGCCTGLVLALAEDAAYIPAYGLVGLLSGLYTAVGMPCALAAAVAAGGGYAVYTNGLTGFLSLVPELSVGALLSWPFLRRLSAAEADFFTPPVKEEKKAPVMREDAGGVARAYREISALLDASAQSEREDGEVLASLCERVKGISCRRCPAGGVCTESEAVLNALKSGKSEGIVCESLPKMQASLARERAEISEKKRFGGEKGALSLEYALHARFLEEREEKRAEVEGEDEEASERLRAHLEKNGFSFSAVRVFGKRRRRVLIGEMKQKESERDEERLCALCGQALGESFPFARLIREGRRFSYLLESVQRYRIQIGIATKAKRMDEPSGDMAVGFEGDDGIAYAALSDGMGSGSAAADAASLCVGALSSLLSAGAREDTALSLVGNLLCAGDEERSVALDLLSVDLYSGRVCFHKSGAAASFMLREDSLYRIRAKTIPMGVLRGVDTEKIELNAAEGDLLVLLSDGVMGGKEDGGWLKTLLFREGTDDLTALAEKILAEAGREHGASDDRTVLLVRLAPISSRALVSA